MSDFLKSAMNYFNAGPYVVGQDNEFVGQIVEISNVKLRIKRVIAEGGFGASSLIPKGRQRQRKFDTLLPTDDWIGLGEEALLWKRFLSSLV